jgi:geranylgeranyl diphosphate synthase type II
MFVWLGAGMFGAGADRIIDSALAVEVFHNFTLVHDDIMDNATERRGRETVHIRWGEAAAILAGDYLLALAYRLLVQGSSERDVHRVVSVFDEMVVALCEGQMLDESLSGGTVADVQDYLQMIDRKTGALLKAALMIGGIQAQASEAGIGHLEAAGAALGRAFQIQDDLLDVTADDDRWGKRRGGDLLEGKQTLLVLHAIKAGNADDRDFFTELVTGRGIEPERLPDAIDRLERLGAIDHAKEEVRRYTTEAEDILSNLPESAARNTLEELMRSLAARTH